MVIDMSQFKQAIGGLALLLGVNMLAVGQEVKEYSIFEETALISELAKKRAKELVEPSPAMDFSRPVVSRGFTQDSLDVNANQAMAKQYRAGQVAYFFGNHAKALNQWRSLAEQGYAQAQASMGWLYQAGLGVKQDNAEALKWYRLGAKQGNAVAQNNLGVMYENGIVVNKDLEKAIPWYRKSAEQGYRFAQFNLANGLLHLANGQPPIDEIKHLLTSAASQGVSQAKKQLQTLEQNI